MLLFSQEPGLDSTQQGFTSSGQPGFTVETGLSLQYGEALAVSLDAGAHSVLASSAGTSLVLYRGFSGLHTRLSLAFAPFPLPPLAHLETRIGMGIGATLHLTQYEHTQLYFFYPSFEFSPLLIAHARGGTEGLTSRGTSIELEFPVQFHLRHDLAVSVSGGIAVRLRWNPLPVRGDLTR